MSSISGPLFLVLYFAAGWIALAVTLVLREAMGRAPGGTASDATMVSLGPYDVAYLRGGASEAVATAIATLVHRGQLAIEKGYITPAAGAGDDDASREVIATQVYRTAARKRPRPALELGVSEAVRAGATTIPAVVGRCASALRGIEVGLEEAQLHVPPSELSTRQIIVRLPVVAFLMIGVARVLQGMSNHRPTGFLLLLILLGCGLLTIGISQRRTRRGDRALRDLADRNAALQSTMAGAPQQLTAEEVAFAAAVFGVAVLGGHLAPVAAMAAPPAPPPPVGGSSCGGSSCGGGCGGGCGGCGG